MLMMGWWWFWLLCLEICGIKLRSMLDSESARKSSIRIDKWFYDFDREKEKYERYIFRKRRPPIWFDSRESFQSWANRVSREAQTQRSNLFYYWAQNLTPEPYVNRHINVMKNGLLRSTLSSKTRTRTKQA